MESDSSIPIAGIILFVLVLILTGIFYGFAAAIQNLSAADAEKKAEEGSDKAKTLLKMSENTSLYVNFIPWLAVLSGTIYGLLIVPFLVEQLDRIVKVPFLSGILIVILTTCILTGGVILTMRRIGKYKPEKTAYDLLGIVSVFIRILYPFTWIMTGFARVIACLFGVAFHKNGVDVTEEEILSVVDEAHEQGVIEENEAEMIQNIIFFNETKAQDIMTHRSNVVAFERNELMDDVIRTMVEEGNSRYPVYDDSLDNIIGIIHFKDVMQIATQNPEYGTRPLDEVPDLIRQASFIPETRGIGVLIKSMQAKQIHLAVVVDEYGQTAGIVTMEDILEEIVGDILDEYDEEEIFIQTQVDDTVLVGGLTSLADVGKELEVDFSEVEFDTLSGYLISLLGHIPTEEDVGKTVDTMGYRFEVLSVDHKTIEQVRVEKCQEEKPEEEVR